MCLGDNRDELEQYMIKVDKKFQCSLCMFLTTRPSKLKNHLESVHFPGMFIYHCDECDKTFNGKNSLNVHRSTHHSKRFH